MQLLNIIKIAVDISPVVTIVAILGCICSLWILIRRLHLWIVLPKHSGNHSHEAKRFVSSFASWGERLIGRFVLVMSGGRACWFLITFSYDNITMGGIAARPLADLTQYDIMGFFVPILLGGISYVLCLVAEQISWRVSQRLSIG